MNYWFVYVACSYALYRKLPNTPFKTFVTVVVQVENVYFTSLEGRVWLFISSLNLSLSLAFYISYICIYVNKLYQMGLYTRKQVFGVCQKTNHRLACASRQSDQHLCQVSCLDLLQANFYNFLARLCSWGAWFESRRWCIDKLMVFYAYPNIYVSWSTFEFRVMLTRRGTDLSPPVKYFTDRSKAVFLL